jgi:hypothetical protein
VPDEDVAESWSDLQELLYEGSWHDDLGLFRSTFALRGSARRDGMELVSNLARLDGDARLEQQLLRAFRKYAAQDAATRDTQWDWLALGQHHGLPTRLLDWTYSPYVALHFATQRVEDFDGDGVVRCVDYVRAHELLPDELRGALEREGGDVFTTELLAETVPDIDALEGENVLFLEPPSFDARIVNQYALFSAVAPAGLDLAQWLERNPQLSRTIVIPAGLKWEVRDKLDQANVTERVLFPGLDGLSQWLRRYYRPRSSAP